MSQKESKTNVESSQPDYLKNVRFKSVPVDEDRLFDKVIYRTFKENPVGKTPFSCWKYIAIAATIALLIVSSHLFFIQNQNEIQPITYMEIASVEGTKTRVLLPDSSVVWLNGNSSIRYPQQFTGNQRQVHFQGEAMFEVKKDEAKPFRVTMDGMDIKVLGTVFNVHAKPDSPLIETTLLEGSIEIYRGNNMSNIADRLLRVNEQAIYNKESGDIRISPVWGELYISWVTGNYNFEGNTMYEIASILQRAFNVSIYIQKESVGKARLSARFTHKESLEEILSILQQPARYKFKREKGQIFIY